MWCRTRPSRLLWTIGHTNIDGGLIIRPAQDVFPPWGRPFPIDRVRESEKGKSHLHMGMGIHARLVVYSGSQCGSDAVNMCGTHG
jgi:hypothetical protein